MADPTLKDLLKMALHAVETESVLREHLPGAVASVTAPVTPEEAGLPPHVILALRLGLAYTDVKGKAGAPFRDLVNSVEQIVGDEKGPNKAE